MFKSKSKTINTLVILFTSVCAWLANYSFDYFSLWLLFLIPALFSVSLYPNWKIVILTGTIFNLTMVSTEYFVLLNVDISLSVFKRIAVALVVWWIIYILSSYSIIVNARLVKKLERYALTDSLTKTYNRRYLNSYMEKALPLFKRGENELALVLFDIDYFKQVNDTYGHQVGDEILKRLSKIVTEIVRESDILVRLGGEEFLLVLPSTSSEQASDIAEKIRRNVEIVPFKITDKDISITLSLGVALYDYEEHLNDNIKMADEALYQAKKNGRNQVAVRP